MFFIPIVLKEITNHKAIANLAEKKLLIESIKRLYSFDIITCKSIVMPS